MTSCTPDGGITVPARAIPPRAWGIGFDGLQTADVAAMDPFGGRGTRLDYPAGQAWGPGAVMEVTGTRRAVTFSGICAWVETERDSAPEEVQRRWSEWLEAPQ